MATLGFTEIRENAKDLISLSADDMNDLETVTEVLRPLKTITAIMCDEKNPTVSLIMVFKMKIIAAKEVTDHYSELVKTVKTAIHTNILERYNSPEIEEFLFLAMALDPRFKVIGVQWIYISAAM